MRILFIKPPTSEFQLSGDELYMNEPIELEYVAAAVADQHDVRILDMRLDQALEENMEKYRPDIVALTSYTPQVYIVRNLCKKIKTLNPDTLTVVGGHHATLSPGDFCDPHVDIIAIGEGVFTFREITQRFESKQDVREVKGVAFSHNGGLKFAEPRDFPDLDTFPFPLRSLTRHYQENYFFETTEGIMKPFANFMTSKGCPHRCKFCGVRKITGGKYLPRDPQAILEELKTIEAPYIYFADDETFIDLKRMDRLADLILDGGIKKVFLSFARSDTVINHPDLFKKWREAGLSRVLIGAESNRPKDLEYFRKKNTTTNNERAILFLKEIGVKTDVTFIIHPDYDIEDFDNLASYAKHLEADFVIFNPLTPFPGTDLYEEVKEQLTTTNLELYDMSHMVLPTKLPLEKFYRELSYIYYKMFRAFKDRYTSLKSDPLRAQKFIKVREEIKNRHLHHQIDQ
jgi:radical SAM superfamily enzyme YgiQ (UPF0313 family)